MAISPIRLVNPTVSATDTHEMNVPVDRGTETIAGLRRACGLQPYDHMWLEDPTESLEAVSSEVHIYRCHPLMRAIVTIGDPADPTSKTRLNCGGTSRGCQCDCHDPALGRQAVR
jgi:hypothetical protein